MPTAVISCSATECWKLSDYSVMDKIRLTFLGTGTSTGVPQIGCNCPVCSSKDSRDKRLRTSALIEIHGRNILIDCGPDFRQQILRRDSPRLDALLVTHTHYDHLGGIDDLRPYCTSGRGFPIYCRTDVAKDIKVRMPYCFPPHLYPGAPRFDIHEIDDTPFEVSGIKVTPLPIMHSEQYRINGYRIGGLSYVTDCKIMPASTIDLIRGSEVLIINALRIESHPTHITLQQALEIIREATPRKAYLTHFSHQIGLHEKLSATLPSNVEMAFDDLTIEI